MNGPTYKDEVYIATETEHWEKTRADAKENGYEFFCESNYSQGQYGLFPFVKSVVTGAKLTPQVDYRELDERLNPPTPIWNTEEEWEAETVDAWKQYHDLLEKYTLVVEPRQDLEVFGHATDRSVEVIVYEDGPRLLRKHLSTGKRNVDTMRELAKAINDACDFVEKHNPTWASIGKNIHND